MKEGEMGWGTQYIWRREENWFDNQTVGGSSI